MPIKITLLIIILLSTLKVEAATKVPWEWTLVVVALISAIVATIITRRNSKANTLGLKILLGGLYFWVITFAQTIVLALVYQFFMK